MKDVKDKEGLRLALPTKGELEEPTMGFLQACGLKVERPSARQYAGTIPSLPGLGVLFLRAADIAEKVIEGSADLGITGLDSVMESAPEESPLTIVMEDLGYGSCELVLAAPDSWVDISTVADLADLAVEMRGQGRDLRVATKYPRLTRRFLLDKGLNYFTLVEASGAMEAAPAAGYADIISDLTSSGVTLRENRLKPLGGGRILASQACLSGNKACLGESPAKRALARALLELMEAHLGAGHYFSVTANIRGDSPEAVAAHLRRRPELAGLQGPTVAPVFSRRGDGNTWYEVTVIIPKTMLTEAVDYLRLIGGSSIAVAAPAYVFEAECRAYRRLLQELGR